MKICVIDPTISKEVFKVDDVRERVKNYVRPDTEVDFVWIDYGPASIECEYDKVLAAPFVVEKAKWAEKNGYDAVVISCMGDPGVQAAKEVLDIPVIGPGEATRQIAPILGEKVARIYPTGLSVLELVEDPDKTYNVLLDNAVKTIADGAQVLILGCTGLTGMRKRLKEKLEVPILEGELLALSLAQLFVDVRLSQSKLKYRKPPEKERTFPRLND